MNEPLHIIQVSPAPAGWWVVARYNGGPTGLYAVACWALVDSAEHDGWPWVLPMADFEGGVLDLAEGNYQLLYDPSAEAVETWRNEELAAGGVVASTLARWRKTDRDLEIKGKPKEDS